MTRLSTLTNPPENGHMRLMCAVCTKDEFLVDALMEHPEMAFAICLNCGAKNAIVVIK